MHVRRDTPAAAAAATAAAVAAAHAIFEKVCKETASSTTSYYRTQRKGGTEREKNQHTKTNISMILQQLGKFEQLLYY